MAHCLVTGATGFIGPSLVSNLRLQGHDVTCLVRSKSDLSRLEPLGIRCAEGDVTDRRTLAQATQDVDIVYHLAGRTHAWSAAEYAKVNELGTENVAATCAASPQVPVLVVVSSLAAAGPSTIDRPKSEGDRDAPISLYGRSKLAGEAAARRLAGDVPLSIVRPPVVFGPGDRDGLVLFRAVARTGIHVIHRGRELPLSIIHSEDLAHALRLVAEKGERVSAGEDLGSGLYYVADPQTISYAQMGQLAAEALERRLRLVKLRPWAFYVPAVFGEVTGRLRKKPSVLNLDKLREAAATGWVCSNEKVTALGYQSQTSLAERYRQTVSWYRAEGWL